MRKSVSRFLQIILFLAIMTLIGCATNQQGYQKAFHSESSLTQNQCTFKQSADSIFMISKQVFIQQGFTIESADLKSGIIKAVRNMQDKENAEISYNIHASADISEVAGVESTVSLAASQQTILHRTTTTWWHLLWIVPIIPTGTEYQTLVVKEGNITDPGFYTDFFNSLKAAVAKNDLAVKAAAAKAAEKAEAERVAAEKAAKIKAEVEAKAAAKKAEVEAKAAAEKAEADRIDAEKANAEKLAAEKEAAAIESAMVAEELKKEEAAAADKNANKKKKKKKKKKAASN